MSPRIFRSSNTQTPYVQLDTRKCKACWKCLETCPQQVIGKVDLPWHKHALINTPDNCNGCLKCIKICGYNSITKIDRTEPETVKHQKEYISKFAINNLLLMSGVVMILSGLMLQLGFHIGGFQEGIHDTNLQQFQYEQLRGIDNCKIVYGLNYQDWSFIHKFAISLFSILMTLHIVAHRKWYKTIINKHLIGKNIQMTTLSVLFFLVAITGIIPWFVDLSGSTSVLRLHFIEIHDKIALILIVFLVLHVKKRKNWFSDAFSKLKG